MPETLPTTTLYTRVFIDREDYEKRLLDYKEFPKEQLYDKEMSFEHYAKMLTKSFLIMPCLTVTSFAPKYFYLLGFILGLFPPTRHWMFKSVTRKIDKGLELVNIGYKPNNYD